jgi:hypothetical protein
LPGRWRLDTEVFLIDYALRLVARAVATLDVQIAPGLYKIKYRQGSRIHDALQIVEPDKTMIEVAVPEAFRPPADASEALPEPQIGMAAARGVFRSRRRTAAPTLRKATLAITIPAGKGGAGSETAGVTIVDESGHQVADLQRPNVADPARAIALATEFQLAPGAYRLRVDSADGVYEQSVVLAPGWRTDVAAKTSDHAAGHAAPDFSDAAILMCGIDDGPPSLEMRRLADSAWAWLAGPQLTIAMSHAQRLVRSDIANPLFALCIAHTLVRQTEIDRGLGQPDATDRLGLIASLVDRLQELVPFHPDLSALEIWLGRKTLAVFALPPMLTSSWSLIVAASARQPVLVPAGSLSSRMAAHIVAAPIWLQWRSDLIDTGPAAAIDKPRQALVNEITSKLANLNAQQRQDMSDLESAILDRLRRSPATTRAAGRGAQNAIVRSRAGARPTEPVVDDLAAALGVPGASVDDALSSILQKLAEKTGASEN